MEKKRARAACARMQNTTMRGKSDTKAVDEISSLAKRGGDRIESSIHPSLCPTSKAHGLSMLRTTRIRFPPSPTGPSVAPTRATTASHAIRGGRAAWRAMAAACTLVSVTQAMKRRPFALTRPRHPATRRRKMAQGRARLERYLNHGGAKMRPETGKNHQDTKKKTHKTTRDNVSGKIV